MIQIVAIRIAVTQIVAIQNVATPNAAILIVGTPSAVILIVEPHSAAILIVMVVIVVQISAQNAATQISATQSVAHELARNAAYSFRVAQLEEFHAVATPAPAQ